MDTFSFVIALFAKTNPEIEYPIPLIAVSQQIIKLY